VSSAPRSLTSGSRAAFSRIVVPSASAAAIMRFSVPVTVTRSVAMRAALQPAGPRHHVAVLDGDLGAQLGQALEMLVDRPHADRAAAGQRHARGAVAGDERPEHEHGGAHGRDQLVGRQIAGHVLDGDA
jgi:hypothetical protein